MITVAAIPRPSSAHRWAGGGCTASPGLESVYTDTPGPAAANGTRLHDLAARVLRGLDVLPDAGTPDGDAIRPYVDDVRRVYAHAGRRPALHVEQQYTWTDGRLRGTPDCVVVDNDAEHVTIWDLKTGWRIVEARDNWQLACYAMLLVPPGWSCDLRIVQCGPWHPDGPIRSWRPTPDERTACDRTIADAFAEATRAGRLRVGAHCLYCRGLRGCPAARDISLAAADWVRGGEPADLPDDEAARELAVLREAGQIVELRRAALEEDISARLRAGRRVRYAQLVEGQPGRLDWTGTEEQTISTVQVLTGIDVSRRVPQTPTQAIKAGVPEAVVRSLSERAPGKMKLEIGSNSRADRVFGKPTHGE